MIEEGYNFVIEAKDESPEFNAKIILAHHYLDKIEDALNEIAKSVGHKSFDEYFGEFTGP